LSIWRSKKINYAADAEQSSGFKSRWITSLGSVNAALLAMTVFVFSACNTADDVLPHSPSMEGLISLEIGDILDDVMQLHVSNLSGYHLVNFNFSLQYFDGENWQNLRTTSHTPDP